MPFSNLTKSQDGLINPEWQWQDVLIKCSFLLFYIFDILKVDLIMKILSFEWMAANIKICTRMHTKT